MFFFFFNAFKFITRTEVSPSCDPGTLIHASLFTLPPNYNFSSLLNYLALPPSSSHSVDDLALYYSEKREKMNRRDHLKVHKAHYSPVSVLFTPASMDELLELPFKLLLFHAQDSTSSTR